RLLPSASWLANALARRIIGPWLALSEACWDGGRIASQEGRNGWGPAMAPGERFDGRTAATVLCREALVVLPQPLCEVRSVGLLQVKRHDGASRRQVLPAMGGADQAVFMNRNRNARAHALGIYFGAMPYPADHLTERSKGFDGMLGIIIIPGDTIIIEECEQFALILLKTFFVVHCYFTLILTREKI